MRKSSILVLFLFTVLATAGPVTITIGLPRAGDVLCKGQKYPIQWATSAAIDKVTIRLIYNSAIISVLAKDINNSGRFAYTVPNAISSGSYTIEVLSSDGKARGVSGSFRIDSCLPTPATRAAVVLVPTITITSPARIDAVTTRGMEGYIGGCMKIQWTTRGRVPSPITISYHRADCSDAGTYLGMANPAAGEALVRIPTTVTWRYGNSAIRVGVALSTPYDCNEFNLMHGPIVTVPTGGSIWHPGESVVVRWREGAAGTTHILLVSEASILRFGHFSEPLDHILAENVPAASGERRITLPADLAPGRYAVFLSCVAVSHAVDLEARYGTFSDVFQVAAR